MFEDVHRNEVEEGGVEAKDGGPESRWDEDSGGGARGGEGCFLDVVISSCRGRSAQELVSSLVVLQGLLCEDIRG